MCCDPTADISMVRQVVMVMKDGVVVKHAQHAGP
jgi:hypothetical protein